MTGTRSLPYRLLNVFTVGDDPFSGNPLCVFEDASGLSDRDMQQMARQLNLSETTFVTPGEGSATAGVRIFTPNYEMPFAGHPTLGTAYVVSELYASPGQVTLRMPAGDIPVSATGPSWTLVANPPRTSPVDVAREDLARMVGLGADSLGAQPLWVDTGTEQLILPLRSADDVRAAAADPQLLRRFAQRGDGESLVYVWAQTGPEEVEARLFFTQNGAAIEDPATGSACANLGGWLHARGERGLRRQISQGSAIHRPSLLHLHLDEEGTVRVSGTVREVGRGYFSI